MQPHVPAQLQLAFAQLCSSAEDSPAPQAQFSQLQDAQAQRWTVTFSVIGTSWVSGFDDRDVALLGPLTLERKGYEMRRLAGATPNIRRNVRLR